MASSSKSNPFKTLHPLIRSRADYKRTGPRLFTQNAQLLRISRSYSRPQLPFLNTHHVKPIGGLFRARLARLMTTEQKKEWKDNIKLGIKWYFIGGAALLCFQGLRIGLNHREWERNHPEPPDWSIWSKWNWRLAHGLANPGRPTAYVDWLGVGIVFKRCLVRLEDPNIDGQGIRPRLGEGEELSVLGVGSTGFDITAKSENWRRGYYQVLMGMARAAERLDGWVKDTTRTKAFPPDLVVGPSNPRPKPMPWDMGKPPKEENCVPAFEEPQVYYMRILTTEGFTSKQRLDAALAYGDFLHFKGLSSSAADMIDWAMDIATANAPQDTIDRKTGIIKNEAAVTENILLAASALALHKSQMGDISSALPIYLSILRARRALPPGDPNIFTKQRPTKKPAETWYGKIDEFLEVIPFPDAPPTGDEPATRTPAASCDEAATMAHIGEILYASSDPLPENKTSPRVATKVQETGLSWTREAVELAEATFRSLADKNNIQHPLVGGPDSQQVRIPATPAEEEAKTRCVECLGMAIRNWKLMIIPLRLAELEKKHGLVGEQDAETSRWMWSQSAPKTPQTDGPGKWEKEERIVHARELEMKALLRKEGLQFKDLDISAA